MAREGVTVNLQNSRQRARKQKWLTIRGRIMLIFGINL